MLRRTIISLLTCNLPAVLSWPNICPTVFNPAVGQLSLDMGIL